LQVLLCKGHNISATFYTIEQRPRVSFSALCIISDTRERLRWPINLTKLVRLLPYRKEFKTIIYQSFRQQHHYPLQSS
jgi:hypothetical protein